MKPMECVGWWWWGWSVILFTWRYISRVFFSNPNSLAMPFWEKFQSQIEKFPTPLFSQIPTHNNRHHPKNYACGHFGGAFPPWGILFSKISILVWTLWKLIYLSRLDLLTEMSTSFPLSKVLKFLTISKLEPSKSVNPHGCDTVGL